MPSEGQYGHGSHNMQYIARSMVVRGAPAIGITAAYGMALAQIYNEDMEVKYFLLLT